MKILILADITAPYRKAVFKGLAKEHDVDVFFNTAKSEQRDPKWYAMSDEELRFYVLNSDEAQAKYDECVKNIKSYDAVLCYDPWHKRSRALQRLCMRKHIPYALNADGARKINMSFPRKQIKSYYTKRAPMLFAGCERAEEYFKAYGAKPERIVRHYFTSSFAAQILEKPLSDSEKLAIKEELGMAPKTTFMAVGQFVHRKGFDLLLDAWGQTAQEGQLYIIGGGPLREEYERTIAEKNLQNVYIEDFKKPDVLLKYYHASDVFVMPTREDIWGLVVNEALGVALPVISSDECTSGTELVQNDVNGYVYPCRDTACLAKYISALASSAEKRERFAQKALEIISPYTIENIIENHLDSIKKLIKETL